VKIHRIWLSEIVCLAALWRQQSRNGSISRLTATKPMMDTRATGRAGRRQKHEALKERDRYWALTLKASGISLAELERGFRAELRSSRSDMSPLLPFSIPKVAAGTRGVSASLDMPAIVAYCDTVVPGSRGRFASLLWTALYRGDMTEQVIETNQLADEVAQRLGAPTISAAGGFSSELLRCLVRVPHPDSFGLLLWNLRRSTGGPSEGTLTRYAMEALNQICKREAAMLAIREALLELVNRWLSRPVTPIEPPQLRQSDTMASFETVPLVEIYTPTEPKDANSDRLDLLLHGGNRSGRASR